MAVSLRPKAESLHFLDIIKLPTLIKDRRFGPIVARQGKSDIQVI